jgi:hypothetical protein
MSLTSQMSHTSDPLKYGMIKYDKERDEIDFYSQISPELPNAGICITHDLGKVISLILREPTKFQNGEWSQRAYFPNLEEADYVHVTSEAFSHGQLANLLEEKTGKKVNFIRAPPFVDYMSGAIKFFEEYGKRIPFYTPACIIVHFRCGDLGMFGKNPPYPDPNLASESSASIIYEAT